MASGIAVVTGGNRGIGREVCRQLVSKGMRVIMGSRDAAGATAAARATGAEARSLDVTDRSSIDALAAGLRGETLASLVNNAGVSLNGFDGEVAARTLAVNYFGAAAVTDALVPLMPPGGRVVMVSSGMGELSGMPAATRERLLDPALDRPRLDDLVRAFIEAVRAGRHQREGWPSNAYSFSKAALNALVRVLATPLAARGIKVNAVCPGWVRTDMGGAGAPRSVEQGAEGIVWAATLPEDGPTGGCFRDGRPVAW
jgi:carbonyl reductase 1